MSSQDDDMSFPFSTSVQTSIINANLNSTLMLFFIMGLYIGIYAITVRIYLTKCSTVHRGIIIGALTVLFLILLAQLAIQWYFALETFCFQGDLRQNIFLSSLVAPSVPPGLLFAPSFLQNITVLLGDGLTVWRCFHASRHSIASFGLPMCFLLAQFALFVTHAVFVARLYFDPNFSTDQHVHQLNELSGAVFCAAAATGMAATIVICRQIYKGTSGDPRSRRRYKHITDALTQSCAVNTTIVFIQTILGFLNSGSAEGSSAISRVILDFYMESLVALSSAIVPTLMVARLTIASKNSSIHTSVTDVDLPSELIMDIAPDLSGGGSKGA